MLIRVRFEKGEGVRFLSHLDMTKTFERAMRRAAIPIAFSEGFNPHPRFAFASALAVGVTSKAEYADFELKSPMAPEAFLEAMNGALPPGLRLLEAREMAQGSKALMSVVNRAAYSVRGDLAPGAGEEAVGRLIERFLAASEVLVERQGKKGPQQKDVRKGLFALAGRVEDGQWELRMVTITGGEGNLRPEDVVKGLVQLAPGDCPLLAEDLDIERRGLWIEQGGQGKDPFGNPVETGGFVR